MTAIDGCNNLSNLYASTTQTKIIDSLKLHLSTASENPETAHAYNVLAYHYMNSGNYDRASENFLNSIRIYEKLNDKDKLLNCLPKRNMVVLYPTDR